MTKLCDALHPDHPTVNCTRPGDGLRANHIDHTGAVDDQFIDWPNVAYQAPERKQKGGTKNKGTLKEMASRVKQEEPKTAQSFKHYNPTEADARGRVALYLLKYLGEWIYVDELEMDTVGGSAGEKKVHELASLGWPLETGTSTQGRVKYRLTEDPRKPLWNAAPGTIPVS